MLLEEKTIRLIMPERIQCCGRCHDMFHGLEESTLSKWPYYPKQSTDSMQSLSSYQRYFSQN